MNGRILFHVEVDVGRAALCRPRRRTRGVTLIMVAGVLAILAALGAGFYTLAISQNKSAARYSDSVRAELMMNAGFSYSVAELRFLAFQDTEHPEASWYSVDYLHGAQQHASFQAKDLKTGNLAAYSGSLANSAGEKSDQYTLLVTDAAGKININACDNLAVVLDNLCRVIGAPLVAANPDMIQPNRWAVEGATGANYGKNTKDIATKLDLYFELDGQNRPVQGPDGSALYGDGYAIAGYRSKNGLFKSIEDVKKALTFLDRDGDGLPNRPDERLEIETKFNALRPYITIASWVDTNTVCTGKFEWVSDTSSNGTYYQMLIDRDKSWVADDIANDPENLRGSLRGSYVSIINGQGAGQLRRIATNGTDWIALRESEKMLVVPGPISSYMIVSAEEAMMVNLDGKTFTNFPAQLPPENDVYLPQTNLDGTFVPNPKMSYKHHPLCIHRAPVNINTASDKVLAALFMGINIQHGIPLAVGTDADLVKLKASWYAQGTNNLLASYESYWGLKRIPADSGKLIFDRPMPASVNAGYDFSYLNNYGSLDPAGTSNINEAQELAYRIILARDKDPLFPSLDVVALTPLKSAAKGAGNVYPRGPFRTWDDFYFRVVKPWDDARTNNGTNEHKASIARMIMAHFNPNTDLLKFNPNIEWINRWGRNFTEMEPVMIYNNNNPGCTPLFAVDPNNYITSSRNSVNSVVPKGAYVTRNYRYKADEMIDKSDMNRSTTEFSFDSNGIFEIQSIGQVVANGEVRAERKSSGLIKVYDVWRETTQRQFVQGHIMVAGGSQGNTNSGQIARDAFNTNKRLALITQPEPLVPLQYHITGQTGNSTAKNIEMVDPDCAPGSKRTVFGRVVGMNVPDVVANQVLPAGYDGQITLATNTSAYDPNNDKDTFLASFDGDLDTADCVGNGHEQAKFPHIDTGTYANKGHYFRVVDTAGLLGSLNDTLVTSDPGLPKLPSGNNRLVYYFPGMDAALTALDPQYYWSNVTLRHGDLRTDGAYLSSPGVSGNTSTLKYLFGDNKENFTPDSTTGNDITMWVKPAWDQGDFRTHEFLNASNPGTQQRFARGLYLNKNGQYFFAFNDYNATAGHSANRYRTNDLACFWEGDQGLSVTDYDYGCYLYGGWDFVNHPDLTAANHPPDESPGYRVQPFRWHFVGMRRNFLSKVAVAAPGTPGGPTGHIRTLEPGAPDFKSPGNLNVSQYQIRPFIDTQLYMEGANTWRPDLYWCFRSGNDNSIAPGQQGTKGPLSSDGSTGQDVKWDWADPAGVTNLNKCFSINNLNYGNDKGQDAQQGLGNIYYHYRYMPDDGTYGVIDEFKISSRDRVLVDSGAPDWANDRVVREQTLSRYYLPASLSSKAAMPVFVSQSLLQASIDHGQKTTQDSVILARVSWTVFTPRFMHEYKTTTTGKFKRTEYLSFTQIPRAPYVLPYKGPFDYETYNDDTAIDDTTPDTAGRLRKDISVERPSPNEYPIQPFDTQGVEVELIDDPAGSSDTGGTILGGATFVDPNQLNQVGTAAKPVSVLASHLRYRVRFLYPVNPLVDPGAGSQVNPATQYLLDTPVFDDISITYLIAPQILDYHLDTE